GGRCLAGARRLWGAAQPTRAWASAGGPPSPDQPIHGIHMQIAQRGGGLVDVQQVIRANVARVHAPAEGADERAADAAPRGISPVELRLRRAGSLAFRHSYEYYTLN